MTLTLLKSARQLSVECASVLLCRCFLMLKLSLCILPRMHRRDVSFSGHHNPEVHNIDILLLMMLVKVLFARFL